MSNTDYDELSTLEHMYVIRTLASFILAQSHETADVLIQEESDYNKQTGPPHNLLIAVDPPHSTM